MRDDRNGDGASCQWVGFSESRLSQIHRDLSFYRGNRQQARLGNQVAPTPMTRLDL
jgi:hypothetical protein